MARSVSAKPLTVFVAGGAGFIGSHFIRALVKKIPHARVVNFDALTYAGNRENLRDVEARKTYYFVKGDIADRKEVARAFRRFQPGYIINFAAATHVDRSIHGEADEFVRTNVMGIAVLLEEARFLPKLKKFLHVSTDEVYGDLPLAPRRAKFTEHSPLRPNSPYAATKAAGDLLCRVWARTYGFPVVVTRCGNNFGPYQYPEKLIPFSILRVLRGNPIGLYGDGNYVRDWIFVQDHCEALIVCLLKGKSGEVYNIGANEEHTNRELAGRILDILEKDHASIVFIKDRPGHDRRYALDVSKIRRELGWRARFRFEEALKETIQWYRGNDAWIRRTEQRGALNPHIKEKKHPI